jgi:DNA-binding Xre family transcriptional regulator
MFLHKLKTDELKKMSLSNLVSICKSLDNNNGDWEDVKQSEYDDILEMATELLKEYQS